MNPIRASFLGLILAAAQCAAAEPLSLRGGGFSAAAAADHLDAALHGAIDDELQNNLRKHGLAAPVAGEKAGGGLLHPLRPSPGVTGLGRSAKGNFVDLDPRAPGRVRDYACGQRSYDTAAGFNHQGLDLFLWPFMWQSMAQDAVEVRAAAAGTLGLKWDGYNDRQCSSTDERPNLLVVLHDDGTLGLYAHFKRGSLTDKEVGQRVEAGEFLGRVGSSGPSYGPHLHFQMNQRYDTASPVIEPHSGQCQGNASLWAEQRPYWDPRLILIAAHSAAPDFRTDRCGEVERPNYQRWFRPGDVVHLAAYYADQQVGLSTEFRVLQPDGSEFMAGTHTPTRQDLDNEMALDASYWGLDLALPTDAPSGLWRAEAQYQGVTLEHSFAVGGPIFAATGLWYDPAQAGHGFNLEVIEHEGQAQLVATWFAHLDGNPVWILGIGPIEGERARLQAYISTGAQFPPNFRSSEVIRRHWGELEFQFEAADRGRVSWRSELPGYASGDMPLHRLGAPADINDDDFDSGMRACVTGSWYDPAQSGQGFTLQVAEGADGRQLLATWYSFHDGQQIWLSGAGRIHGQSAEIDFFHLAGGQFPPHFDPDALSRQRWGKARFELSHANQIKLHWQPDAADAPASQWRLQRLTSTLTAPCQ